MTDLPVAMISGIVSNRRLSFDPINDFGEVNLGAFLLDHIMILAVDA